jgi:hypothetical protein
VKKCSHCGRENADEASHCSECGTQLIAPATNGPTRILFPRKHLLLRILIAGCVGLLISGVALKVAWQQSRSSIAWWEQRQTEFELDKIREAVRAYLQLSNVCPDNFEQLQSMTNYVVDLEYYHHDKFADYWGYPFVFLKEGTNCVVVSYGQDGKPGGVGIDCDLTTTNSVPKESTPTFGQFWSNERTQDMIGWCFICGLMAALLSFLTVRIPDFTRRGLIILGLSLMSTIVGAFLISIIITVLHVPSGH